MSKLQRQLRARANSRTGEVKVRCRDGKFHRYLNYSLPESKQHTHLFDACPHCGQCTAELIDRPGTLCADCHFQRIALIAMRLQRDGAELGYPMPPWMQHAPIASLHVVDGRGWGETPYVPVQAHGEMSDLRAMRTMQRATKNQQHKGGQHKDAVVHRGVGYDTEGGWDNAVKAIESRA